MLHEYGDKWKQMLDLKMSVRSRGDMWKQWYFRWGVMEAGAFPKDVVGFGFVV